MCICGANQLSQWLFNMVDKRKLKKAVFKKVLVFDENSRREYLLGFRKRKNERRKQAQQELIEKEKAKKRELKQEKKRNFLEQMEKQRKELEAYDSDVDEGEDQQDIPSLDKTYDLPEHVVTVTTIDDIDLNTDRFPVIGPNKGLLETSNLKEADEPLSEKADEKDAKVKVTEKKSHKSQRSHKKFRKKRNNKKSMHKEDERTEKNKKRKHSHFGFHGKSKKSKNNKN